MFAKQPKYKTLPFYNVKNKPLELPANYIHPMTYLEHIGNGYRFLVNSPDYSSKYVNISFSTMKRLVRNGHFNCQAWMFVNPQTTKSVNENGHWRTVSVPSEDTNNFTIDLDGFFINDTEELRQLLKDRDVPECLITKSSSKFGHFQLAFFTNYKGVNLRFIMELAAKIVDVVLPQDQEEALRLLAEKGVDRNYLVQNHKMHKIRMPGFANYNYGTRKYDYSYGDWISFIKFCNGEIDYSDVKPRPSVVVQELNLPEQEEVREKTKPKKRKKTGRLFTLIKEEVVKIVGRKGAYKLTEFLFENKGFLKGSFPISQTNLSKLTKVEQGTISRKLRELCKSGVLIRTKSYYNHNPENGKIVCMEYTWGMKIRQLFHKSKINIKKQVSELLEEYTPGLYNESLMKDIRKLHYLNASQEEAVDFLYEKGVKYRKDYNKQVRSRSQIANCFANFIRKCTFKYRRVEEFDTSQLFEGLKC